jgi:hypothetical protein
MHDQEIISHGVVVGHAKHRRPAFRSFAASHDGGVNGHRAKSQRPSVLTALHAPKSPPFPTVGS